MLVVGIILFVLGALLIYWNIPYSPYRSSFIKDINQKTEEVTRGNVIKSGKEISELPEPLQNYLKYIGIDNHLYHPIVNAYFSDTDFVIDTNSGKTINMDYDLWLYFDKPYRMAYCTAKMFGVPFDGIDYCTEEKTGGMKGILGKTIKIFDQCNEQGYKAMLLSWIAEGSAFNPHVLLSEYVSYEEIDDNHVKATVNYNGITASGEFTINDKGQITQFYSDERQVEEIDGVLTPIGWRCDFKDYKKNGTVISINRVSCVKVLKNREFIYFDSDNIKLTYPE